MSDEFEIMLPDEEGWSDWLHPLPGFIMKCCDCGLLHELQFAIGGRTGSGEMNEGETKNRVILFRARRAAS